MMLRVKQVHHIGEYKLKILFSNDITKVVDFTDWIDEGGVYATPLMNNDYFKKVKMDEFNYSICWPNGADFSPNALYEKGVIVKEPRSQSKSPSKPKKRARISYKAAALATKKLI